MDKTLFKIQLPLQGSRELHREQPLSHVSVTAPSYKNSSNLWRRVAHRRGGELPVGGHYGWCILACVTEYFFEIVNVVPTNVTVPSQKTLIASQWWVPFPMREITS